MAGELRFDDKVVIVTGAGGGLGRAHALAFGARGAKVVVNDLGGSAHGEGKSASAADHVVEEIREAGGEAVASYDSVEDGAKIVEAALDAFGRVDVVVNNAGILRDVSFHKMTEEDWDLVYRVHVKGSYAVTRAAWDHMREQRYGRIVMTASAAGIYGNFGQANYAMAKLGLTGFANTLAVEGRKRGVLVNTIAPIAGSRLTETVLPKELIDALRPEYVSPLVLWLCHESCEETGGLFEVGGGYFGKVRWERAAGKTYRVGRAIRPEDVKSAWDAISGFEESEHPASINESMQPIMENLQRGASKGGNQYIDVDEALGYAFPPVTSRYDEKDLALYALGVGAGGDPLDDRELGLVYELHGQGFKALPTFGVIPAINVILEQAKKGVTAPGLHYGFDRVLHGEQVTELERPLPPHAKLRHEARIKDIFDKGKGALVVTEIDSYDEDGDLLVHNEVRTFVRGAGGWGGDRGPSAEVNVPPDRAPDAVVEEHIPENQALLYRLSGDWNPLHADPSFAKAFGFDRPILHGLCTFGYAGRHVIAKLAPKGDPRFFKRIEVRFAKNVFPGETLVTEMWKESDLRVVFRCKVKERDEVVISNAALELYEQIPKKAAKPKAAPTTDARTAAPSAPTSADIFAAIRHHVETHPELASKVGNVFLFRLTDPESAWTIDLEGAARRRDGRRGRQPGLHPGDQRGGLHRHGQRQGRRAEALLLRQAEDQRQRHGQPEAHLPVRGRSRGGQGGGREGARRAGGRWNGARAGEEGTPAGRPRDLRQAGERGGRPLGARDGEAPVPHHRAGRRVRGGPARRRGRLGRSERRGHHPHPRRRRPRGAGVGRAAGRDALPARQAARGRRRPRRTPPGSPEATRLRRLGAAGQPLGLLPPGCHRSGHARGSAGGSRCRLGSVRPLLGRVSSNHGT